MNVVRRSELAKRRGKSKEEESATVILDDMPPPKKPAYVLFPGTKVIDFGSKEYEKPEYDAPAVFGEKPAVTADVIIQAIRKDIGDTGYSLHITDKQFTKYSMQEVRNFITYHDTTRYMQLIEEVFDCDDFAQVLQGNVNRVLQGIPFGTIWFDFLGGLISHAVNIGYCHVQGRMYLVEPQSDNFYFFNRNHWQAVLIIL